MEVKFLDDLLSYGIREGYFTIEPLKCIDESIYKPVKKIYPDLATARCLGWGLFIRECSTVGISVIDFDKVKERYTAEKGGDLPKSCDALKIISAHKRLDFIEKKSVSRFLKRIDKPNAEFNDEIQKQLTDFNFAEKISKSLEVLQFILDKSNLLNELYSTIDKQFIIVTDIDITENAIQDLSFTLNFLGQSSNNPRKEIATKLGKNIAGIKLDNIKTPKLFSCKELAEYYREQIIE